MIAENSEKSGPSTKTGRLLPWINLGLAIVLIALGIWYLADKVSLEEIIQALLLFYGQVFVPKQGVSD